MSRRNLLCAVLVGLGILARPLGLWAQIAPQDPERQLPAAARARMAEDDRAYDFSRSLKAVMARARQARAAALDVSPSIAARSVSGAVSGNYSIPVFLTRFSNTSSVAFPPVELEDALFDPNPAVATLRAYYLEQSHGQLDVSGQVFGWWSLPQPDTYYEGATNGLTPGDARTGELILSTLAGYDAVLDFGAYDNDGPDGIPNSGDDDGYVDFVAFVHPEEGGECGGSSTNLWSHRWRYSVWPASGSLPYSTDDASASGGNILIDDYVLQPGLRCGGTGRIQIGVFCHEFGHTFGLPDLYDINGGGAQGLGHWGLMASGNWNTPESPAHMSAWTKQQLGWVETVPLDWAQTTMTIAPVQPSHRVYEVNVDAERWGRSTSCSISGAASLAVGIDASESAARGWSAAMGYGNGWVETVAHDFHSDGASPVTLDYDYQIDSEGGFDFAFVLIEIAGVETTLAVYDGSAAGHASHDLGALLGPGEADYRIKFRFRSDQAYSNEDGLFVSGCSPFVVDQIAVVGGGENSFADFEVHRQGWYSPDEPRDNPPSESWLVENRRAQGFDAMLHGEGLIVYHVDQEVIDTASGNSGGGDDTRARGLVVEEADGQGNLLSSVVGNRGDAGDPWPGATAASVFDSVSTPPALSHRGQSTNFAMQIVSVVGDSVRATFSGGAWPPAFTAVTPDSASADSSQLHLELVGATRVHHGAILRLVSSAGAEVVSTATRWDDEDRAGFDFELGVVAPGSYDVVLQNPNGQNAVLATGLRLSSDATAAPTAPQSLRLAQNYPNPFNPRTTIVFETPGAGAARLCVYDAQGRRVRTLVDESVSAGSHRVQWNGEDDRGHSVASGLYFYRLETETGTQQRKMLLVR